MAEPFLAEIRVFSFNFAPQGWAQCNGQLLTIQQNQALYTLLGQQFGGDGRVNFGLPNLQGSVPVNPNSTIPWSAKGGEVAHVLTVGEMPAHTHEAAAGTDPATQRAPTGGFWSVSAPATTVNCYSPNTNAVMSQKALSTAGSSQAHPNMQPYVVLNYCIALAGIYPPKP